MSGLGEILHEVSVSVAREHLGYVGPEQVAASVRASMERRLHLLVAAGEMQPKFVVFDVFLDPCEPSKMSINMSQNFALYPLTDGEFEGMFGYKPELDDLERINCKVVGTLGHWQCGWCLRHNKMRKECGCLLVLP